MLKKDPTLYYQENNKDLQLTYGIHKWTNNFKKWPFSFYNLKKPTTNKKQKNQMVYWNDTNYQLTNTDLYIELRLLPTNNNI